MTDQIAHYLAMRARLEAGHAYRRADERDACGVGFVAALDGTPRRDVVEKGLKALKAVWHRGAVDSDGKTGDGAGLRVALDPEFFRAQLGAMGREPRQGPVAVGQVFLPRTDVNAQGLGRAIVETELSRAGFALYGWRQVPVNAGLLGAKANATRPEIAQVLFHDPLERENRLLERDLFLVRRRIERRARDAALSELYICSLGHRDVVYKGMFLAEQIGEFFTDLQDPRMASHFVMFHQRYSTNTFPEWRLAQPFRVLAHNGEINTLRGNANWMRSREQGLARSLFGEEGDDALPIIPSDASDSAALDAVFELLLHADIDAPTVKSIMMPEAWSKRTDLISPDRRALYLYANAVMEPWDGPAAVAAFDGRWAIAGLDRNGLRPLRWALTRDGLLSVGSETGMCPLAEDEIIERGAVGAGAMIGVDFSEGRFLRDEQLLAEVAAAKPYREWLGGIRNLETELADSAEPAAPPRDRLLRLQMAAGYTLEDLEIILRPAVDEAKEAVGSMGDDTPLAVLSDRYRPLYHYFRQNFAQVTNPAIDPLREARVMSLKTRFHTLPVLSRPEEPVDILSLESPVLTNGMMAGLEKVLGDTAVTLSTTFAVPDGRLSGKAMRAALKQLCDDAEAAVSAGADSGCRNIILSDRDQGPGRAVIPAALAVGAVQKRLVETGWRRRCSITVKVADALDSHALAVLIGVGATTVNPYLAFDTVADMQARGLFGSMSATEAAHRFRTALEAGLLKIMAKLGISVISSYRGGCNFEALGLSRTMVANYFTGLTSRISGIGISGLERQVCERHDLAWNEDVIALPVGGFYRQRASGERHLYEAELVSDLRKAAQQRDDAAFRSYVEKVQSRPPAQLRDLLDMVPLREPVRLSEVETVNRLRKRFVTPGMSLGALSKEAHGALNIAMNRIGARSVSGEGGEDPSRYQRRPNGDDENSAIKQVASGRFGVSARYLNECREIEIKVAQGAKPGEGGQLPGFKVTEFIARMRNAKPGTTLISPPPHHDIYSIEDLAQLIYDLKQINPEAEVCVKLVAGAGIGTIAAGVAKAKADVILISGHVGGTGASPQTSIKFAGLPWEMGLAEAHQVLTLNGLREQVTLRTDGGIRTGRDVVIAAMLGAEQFGVGTASLVALGCLMVRQCHSNTCPVGICTQDEELRARFAGKPEDIVNLMTLLAEDVRRELARLGVREITEIIGRCDLLHQVKRGGDHLDDLDLSPLLLRADASDQPFQRTRQGRQEVPDSLDADILSDVGDAIESGGRIQVEYTVSNTHRAVGTRLSSHIVRRHGEHGLAADRIWVNLRGSAGQSLGAFAVQGLRLDLLGDANDYVGKGLSGATISVRPPNGHIGAVIGNTCLYGATSGRLFAAGRAGERFAVRNSGATAVVEGCGANGCEYMTGGAVMILGRIGDNFGAGMTGGIAFLHDPNGRAEPYCNLDSIELQPIDAARAEQARALLEEHVAATGSERAAALLGNWESFALEFVCVVPRGAAMEEPELTERELGAR